MGGEAEVERTWRFALRDVKARATFYSQIVYRVSLCNAVKQSAEGFLLLLFYTERADYNAESPTLPRCMKVVTEVVLAKTTGNTHVYCKTIVLRKSQLLKGKKISLQLFLSLSINARRETKEKGNSNRRPLGQQLSEKALNFAASEWMAAHRPLKKPPGAG